MTVRVLLADDQAVVRAGFRTLLELTDDLVVVGEAVDGEQAVALARREQPDVVLMDVRMPRVDGIEATRRIVGDAATPSTRVLVLTTFDVDEHVIDALRAGASGFLLKDVDPPDLHAAIRSVAAGEDAIGPAALRHVVDELRRPRAERPVDGARLDVLTDREREVVQLVARGLSNAEIGDALVMSPLTAKTHVSRSMTKLGLRDRVQLVIVAYETGLVGVDPG